MVTAACDGRLRIKSMIYQSTKKALKSGYLAVIALVLLTGCDKEPPSVEKNLQSDILCDFHAGTCRQSELGLTLTPAQAPSEVPLELGLTLPEGWQVRGARVEGRDMFMGVIPVRFDADGRASLLYGSCSSGYMVWRLWLTLENAEGEEVIRFFDWRADAPLG